MNWWPLYHPAACPARDRRTGFRAGNGKEGKQMYGKQKDENKRTKTVADSGKDIYNNN